MESHEAKPPAVKKTRTRNHVLRCPAPLHNPSHAKPVLQQPPRALANPNPQFLSIIHGAVQKTAGAPQAGVVLHLLRQVDEGAGHLLELNAYHMSRISKNVKNTIEVVHGSRHLVGVKPPMQGVVDPLARLRGEDLELSTPTLPTGEAEHLIVWRMVGIKGQNRELGPAPRQGKRNPPPGRRIAHVETRREAAVEEEEAVAAVYDARVVVEREVTQVGLEEGADVRVATVPGLQLVIFAVETVEHAGENQREPLRHVAVGDEALPCWRDAFGLVDALEGKTEEDL
ncbi:hypothetical protein HPP92_023202 [Vanilla planifolia]|uniref:Uncharacterized protein n=1 Tax=Vanilla planifolia TaxID=51239 RepID=A0A835PPY1_VANPL|nr:hypothetical protein HPP92_023202 [Vanilla planifolia]